MRGSLPSVRTELPQQQRLLAALVYFVALVLLARYLNGTFWPPYGLEGLWFYAAAAALLIAEFLLEPFFTRPADALASGLAILVAAATASLEGADISNEAVRAGRVITIGCASTVVLLAVIAISFKDAAGTRGILARASTALVSRVGRARWLFSALLLASGYAAFADSSEKVAVLYLAWFGILVLAPVESLLANVAGRQAAAPVEHGVIESLYDPSIVIARLPRGSDPQLGSRVEIADAGATGTVVEVTRLSAEPRIRVALDQGMPVSLGSELEVTESRDENRVIGDIVEGTTIDEIAVATIPEAAELGLEEGRLVEVQIGGTPTLYQIVGAEIVPRKEGELHRHLVRVTGRKLGRWNAERTVFEAVGWVPSPGTPVRLMASIDEDAFSEDAVGQVPGTNYGIAVDPHLAVTHSTAILGILGIGKTHLAWELIRRMLVAGIKVVALDITGRYSQHFDDVCPPEAENAIAEAIEARIAGNAQNRAVRDDEVGNVRDFEQAVEDLFARFVSGEERLLIFNPNRFDVTRMEGRPFQGQANMMAHLTMVEVTRIVAERLLSLLQELDRDPHDESATLCLVIEEAHSLIPEWNSATNDAERQAVNGAARAVLQGRKYGYGCLLVTQRTANVTKSILNQCNTIFGMRVYDATGMGFLENYIGPTYAQLLASLRDQQAIVFGRASSCNSPIIIDLNDSGVLLERFWGARGRAATVPRTHVPEREEEPGPIPGAQEDEIPF